MREDAGEEVEHRAKKSLLEGSKVRRQSHRRGKKGTTRTTELVVATKMSMNVMYTLVREPWLAPPSPLVPLKVVLAALSLMMKIMSRP